MLLAGSKTRTILIVDDQSAVRDVLRRILERAGHYAIAEASNVKEALAVIGKTPPEAIILDISMPGGPGSSIISALRRIHAETKVLVLSSHHQMKKKMLAMGADAFLPKTTPSKQVLETLARIIGT